VDLRSVSPVELDRLDANLKQAVPAALEEENAAWSSEQKLAVEIVQIGSRPAGEQAPDAEMVQMALSVDRLLGITSSLEAASTDANIPISLGIPALTLGSGGKGLHAHSLAETFDTENSHVGAQRAFLMTVALAGWEEAFTQ
jgi:di/tripeptidase